MTKKRNVKANQPELLGEDFPANESNSKNLEELQKENDILLKQLHFLQEKIEKMYAENYLAKNQKKTLYGAGERVKSSLSYRVGNTLVKRSKSIVGILLLPSALLKEVRVYRLENEKMAFKNMPPLEDYSDYALALKAKKHLSYRVGEVIVGNCSSISKWPSMLKSIFSLMIKK